MQKDQASVKALPIFWWVRVSAGSGWLWSCMYLRVIVSFFHLASISWILGWMMCITRPGVMWCWWIKCRAVCMLDNYSTMWAVAWALKWLLERHHSHLWAQSSHDLFLPKTRSIKTTHDDDDDYNDDDDDVCTRMCAHVCVQVGMHVPLCTWRLEDDFGESSSPFTLLRLSLYFCWTLYSRLAGLWAFGQFSHFCLPSLIGLLGLQMRTAACGLLQMSSGTVLGLLKGCFYPLEHLFPGPILPINATTLGIKFLCMNTGRRHKTQTTVRRYKGDM